MERAPYENDLILSVFDVFVTKKKRSMENV